jgi:hypothetical protein
MNRSVSLDERNSRQFLSSYRHFLRASFAITCFAIMENTLARGFSFPIGMVNGFAIGRERIGTILTRFNIASNLRTLHEIRRYIPHE